MAAGRTKNFSDYTNTLAERFNALSLRERVLVLAGIAAIIVALWLLTIQSTLDSRQQALQQTQTDLAAERADYIQRLALLGAAGTGTTSVRQRELEQLRQRLLVLDENLMTMSQGLIGADQLPLILEEVLTATGQLTLVQLRTLPVDALTLGRGTAEETGVFKHTVALRISGNYFQLVEFLKTLENLPWRFYWEKLDYEVDRYPGADIEIRVYTLSAEEGLLGV